MFSGAVATAEHVGHSGMISESMLFAWGVWLFIIIVSIITAANIKRVPGKLQLCFEFIFSFVFSMADDMIGPKAKRYYPLFVGLFIFILIGNTIGLIPGLIAPTADPNLTFGLAIMVFLYYNFEGLRTNGFGYFKQFVGPPLPIYLLPLKILLVFVEVLSLFIKPFSLGLRLFCNIYSKELFLATLAVLICDFFLAKTLFLNVLTVMPFILRPIIILLGLLLGVIQAFIFTLLSVSYIGGAIESEHH